MNNELQEKYFSYLMENVTGLHLFNKRNLFKLLNQLMKDERIKPGSGMKSGKK